MGDAEGLTIRFGDGAAEERPKAAAASHWAAVAIRRDRAELDRRLEAAGWELPDLYAVELATHAGWRLDLLPIRGVAFVANGPHPPSDLTPEERQLVAELGREPIEDEDGPRLAPPTCPCPICHAVRRGTPARVTRLVEALTPMGRCLEPAARASLLAHLDAPGEVGPWVKGLETWGRPCVARAALAIAREALRRGIYSGGAKSVEAVTDWLRRGDATLPITSIEAASQPWEGWLTQVMFAHSSPAKAASSLIASVLHRGLPPEQVREVVRAEVGAWARGEHS